MSRRATALAGRAAWPAAIVRALALVVVAALVIGCGARPRAVAVGEGEPSTRRSATPAPAREYVVVRGDTLYQIAFRHGLDYREVARWNGIDAPYTIYPGQRLRLVPPPGGVSVPPPERTAPAPQPTPPPAPRPAPPPAQPSRPPPAPSSGAIRWQWPAQGELLSRFSVGDPTRQGIDIAGRAGDPVRAAAAGQVVYSGAGLVGYGEMIIVKHDDTWLSAYAHNRKRLVAEGERVSAGQQIAELGRSGASRDMLHFEIRRNGKPVDPLGLLPQR